MPISLRALQPCALLLVTAAALLGGRPVSAQTTRSFSVGADYTFIRTNVLPGCNCVGLQGGSGEAQYAFGPHLAATADVTVGHRTGITPDGYTLTQMSYMFGARYWPTRAHSRLRPFADVSAGGAHAFGNLSPGRTISGGSSDAFAMQAGGGVQVAFGRRLTLQPIQAEYLMTTFANGAGDRQNDLRLSTGVLFRLTRVKN